MSLFQKSVQKHYLSALNRSHIDKMYSDFQAYFGNTERQQNIRQAKEEQFQEGFLRELFVNILGYTVNAEKGSPLVEPFVAEVKVEFVTPLSASSLGKSPYRAFIISNKRRGHEIHLPAMRLQICAIHNCLEPAMITPTRDERITLKPKNRILGPFIHRNSLITRPKRIISSRRFAT